MRGFKAIILVVGAVLLLGAIAYGIMPTLNDFRTEDVDQNVNVSTGVGATTATLTLGSSLWNDSLSYLSLSSNNSNDVPAATSYNATTKVLAVSGLSDNSTRTLTVSYKVNGLEDNRGVEEGVKSLPTVLILVVIALAISVVLFIFMRK